MRILLILVVILTGLSGGYYYQWQKQAELFKNLAVSRIEALNAGPEADGIDISITYQDIGISGFPFSHRITLNAPVIKSHYSMEAIHALINNTGSDEAAVAVNDSEAMDSTLTLEGDLSISVNYLSTSTDLVIDGNFSGEDMLKEDVMRWKMERSGPARCSVDFRSSATVGMFKTFVLGQPMDNEQLARHLESFSCSAGEQRILSAENNEPLGNLSTVNVELKDIVLHGEGGEMGFHLIVDMPKMETYDTYQRFYGSFGSGVRPSEFKLSPLKEFDMVGAQSLALDARFNMVKPGGFSSSEQPKSFLLDIKQMHMANKLWNLDYPLYISMDQQPEIVNFVMRYNGKGKVEPTFDMAVQEALTEATLDPSLEESLLLAFPDAEPEAAHAFLAEAMPRVSGFGNLSMDIDVEGSAGTQGGMPSGTGGVTARALNFISDVYSLKMQGSYEAAKNEGMLTIDCLQCDKLVADAVEYNNRVQKAYASVNPSHVVTLISTDMYESIMKFLKGLNTGKSEDDITISIVSNGQGNVTVSNKPMFQVMMEAMQVMQPVQP